MSKVTSYCPDCQLCPQCQMARDFGITRQEKVILEKLAEARNTREICRDLNISEDTLKRHITNMCDKTGRGGRLELVLMAIEERWVKVNMKEKAPHEAT